MSRNVSARLSRIEVINGTYMVRLSLRKTMSPGSLPRPKGGFSKTIRSAPIRTIKTPSIRRNLPTSDIISDFTKAQAVSNAFTSLLKVMPRSM